MQGLWLLKKATPTPVQAAAATPIPPPTTTLLPPVIITTTVTTTAVQAAMVTVTATVQLEAEDACTSVRTV